MRSTGSSSRGPRFKHLHGRLQLCGTPVLGDPWHLHSFMWCDVMWCVCVCVYIYIYLHVCNWYIYVCICMRMCVYNWYICVCVCVHMCMYVYLMYTQYQLFWNKCLKNYRLFNALSELTVGFLRIWRVSAGVSYNVSHNRISRTCRVLWGFRI